MNTIPQIPAVPGDNPEPQSALSLSYDGDKTYVLLQDSATKVEVLFKRQKRKTLAIHVNLPPLPLELRMPNRCSQREALQFLTSKLDWIHKTLTELLIEGPGIHYEDGAQVPFLGRWYELRWYAGASKVTLGGAYLMVRAMSREPRNLEALLSQFYKKQAQSIFPNRLAKCIETFPRQVTVSDLTIRKMKSRWGSCSRSGVICLNSQLLQWAEPYIDFVIKHELCHRFYFDHSKDFYALMDQAEPNWRDLDADMAKALRPPG